MQVGLQTAWTCKEEIIAIQGGSLFALLIGPLSWRLPSRQSNFHEEKRLVKKVWKNALGRSRLISTIEEIDKRKNWIRTTRETRGYLRISKDIAHYAYAFAIYQTTSVSLSEATTQPDFPRVRWNTHWNGCQHEAADSWTKPRVVTIIARYNVSVGRAESVRSLNAPRGSDSEASYLTE